jgi:CRP/FNR family transcriptional regulator, anaerobic regulatory protein
MVASGCIVDAIVAFPTLRSLNSEDHALLERGSMEVAAAAGANFVEAGEQCPGIVLMLRGSVAMMLRRGSRSILVHRLRAGDICPVAVSCLLSGKPCPVTARAEIDSRALVVSAGVFDQLLSRHAEFRRFVFDRIGSFQGRVVELVDDLVFGNLERRLVKRLLEESGSPPSTHQRLAADLGTSREVISRTLKMLGRRGLVVQRRGRIELMNPGGLRNLTHS